VKLLAEFSYESKKTGEKLLPRYIRLDDSFLPRDVFELALNLKEEIGMSTLSQFIEFSILFYCENQAKGERLNSLIQTTKSRIGTINMESEEFISQRNLHVLKKLGKDTWGGQEH
jgi:hypothetical protein